MRQKKPDPPAELPAWIMTYSDVITLLMTFFILLLTFSSSEKERFERLQSSLSGGAGGTGFAGKTDGAQDALVVRARPRSARQTMRGSETPPIQQEASTKSLNKGLESLQADPRDPQKSRAISISLSLMKDTNGQFTGFGRDILQMLATQLRRFPLSLSMQVATAEEVKHVMEFVMHLQDNEKIRPGRMSIGIHHKVPVGSARIVLSQMLTKE